MTKAIRVRIEGSFRGKKWVYEDDEHTSSSFIWLNLGPQDDDPSLFWWSEGNGGCDCNRVRFMPQEMQDVLIGEKGEDGLCGGCEINIDRIIPLEGKDLPVLELNESDENN